MKYYTALFQKIKEYYKTQTTNDQEIALICPSLRVYEESEMKLLLPQMLIDEALKGEALLKKQDISFQLNSIPSSDKYWDINPSNTLFEAYSKIINTQQEVVIEENEQEIETAKKILYDTKGNPTKEKKAYDKYITLFDTLLMEWEEHVYKFNDLTTDDEKQVWLEQLNIILLKKEKLIIDHKLLGYKNDIEKAMKVINKSDGFDVFLSSLINSRNVMENSKKTGIQSLESYHDINFVPYDFMSNDNGWTKLSLDKKELDTLYETVQQEKNDFPEEIISIEYDEKNILGVELEFSIVSMQRNWFALSPILSSFFKWKEAKSISDGFTISNEFILPAFTKKMILIKNLKINIDPSIDSDEVSNINQLIHFGPILMKNQLFVNAQSQVKFVKAIKNKETLKSNNIKYYRAKANITPITLNTPVRTAPARTTAKPTANARTIARPVTRVNPIKPTHTTKPIQTNVKPAILASSIRVNPVLFQPAKVLTINNNLATIVVNIKDSVTKEAVYKSEISIIGTNNSYFKEIESDKEGAITFKLPIGNYKIKIVKDGYSILEQELKVANKNTISNDYLLSPESVNYDSYFLIGMICEKLPKINTTL
ncbi:hypothetical protein [Flavobacterium sp. J27]|uniref:hypothetical protein n=1 Tax=Flavobacterium sp. J27 TaxID=2060419 RepID=UPI001030A538|nr:hypothetical protein [Flavobacterium sp. J27]